MKGMLSVAKTVFGGNRVIDWPTYCFRAVVWQVRKSLGHIFTARLANGAAVRVYPASAYSGIFYTPAPEGNNMEFIRKHYMLADTFVDVGANVGLFSASLFDCFQKIVCFEPAPSAFRALCETSNLNPAVSCDLHNIGVGDTRGELIFENEPNFSTTSRFVAEQGPNTIQVPVDTLDNILGQRFSKT